MEVRVFCGEMRMITYEHAIGKFNEYQSNFSFISDMKYVS